MAICYYICTSYSFVMDFCEQTELGDSWCNECDDYILLVSVNWNIRVCLWRLVSQHMDRFLTSCFSRFTTSIEALTILRCHALVTPCPSLNYFISNSFLPTFFFLFFFLFFFFLNSIVRTIEEPDNVKRNTFYCIIPCMAQQNFNILKHFYIHSMLVPFSFLLHFPL